MAADFGNGSAYAKRKIYPSQTETVLKVPAEAIGDYKTATNWNTGRFKAIEAIE